MDLKIKHQKRHKRHRRVRAKISGNSSRPRLCIFRSQKHIYAQLIDDQKGKVLAATSDLELKSKKEKKGGKSFLAFEVGKMIAEKAKKLNVKKAVFDRGGYKYHGRIKSLEEGARKGGLNF